MEQRFLGGGRYVPVGQDKVASCHLPCTSVLVGKALVAAVRLRSSWASCTGTGRPSPDANCCKTCKACVVARGRPSGGLEGNVSKCPRNSHDSPIDVHIAGVVCRQQHATVEQNSSCALGWRGRLQTEAPVCTMAGRLSVGLAVHRPAGGQACTARFVAGTRGHTPSHGCLPAGPTQRVAVHGWGKRVERECFAAGGASHQL